MAGGGGHGGGGHAGGGHDDHAKAGGSHPKPAKSGGGGGGGDLPVDSAENAKQTLTFYAVIALIIFAFIFLPMILTAMGYQPAQ